MIVSRSSLFGVAIALAAIACGKSNAEPAQPVGGAPAQVGGGAVTAAEVGRPAPDFTLKDLDGHDVSLASFRGKVVVLEWFNPDCPFVVRAHNEGALATMARDVAKAGVVWLAINSGAPGKQGAGVDRNRAALSEYKLEHPILLDESGTVGKLYQATNTPGMYVVDEAGVLAYAGAIDNAPRGTPPEDGYRNHVAEALADLAARRAVRVPETKQYGCSVKYAD